MEKTQKINLAIFLAFIALVIPLSYVLGSDFMGKQEKPWHMQDAIHEDSLSQEYLHKYTILDKVPVALQVELHKEKRVLILIDAWGVPINESRLEKEFNIFSHLPHQFFIHKRLSNRTKHAEHVEFRKNFSDAVYIFGGDSLDYGRKEYVPTLGYTEQFYCQKCSDSAMIVHLDSMLSETQFNTIAWTTQDSRQGDEDKLISLLKNIANLAEKHSTVQFVIQGAHRPILGSPEKRRECYAHWVPVVTVNP